MTRRILAATVAATLAGLLIPLLASPAAAHEERVVGKYHFLVGFGDEPTYAGEKNSVLVELTGANGKPVTDLGNTLKVAVSTGSAEPLELAMEPNFEVGEFGTPGDYRAWFIPTAPGPYTFHFTGTIKGQQVDATFKSGPETFDEAKDPAEIQYPVKQPAASQLATRADRETARVNAALTAERDQATDDAASARTLAIIGLVVGVLGLAAAIVALVRGHRPTTPAAPSADAKSTTAQRG
ncbi:MAG TPA: hypothetical protein VID07_11530 [Actinomycetes bacterium]|jgi:hypothetical protein